MSGCIIEQACNRVAWRIYRQGNREWRGGVIFALSAVAAALGGALLLVWGVK